MRHVWAFVILLIVAIAPTVRADPALTMPGPTEGLVQWTFSNPANYTLSNVSLVSGGAALVWFPGFGEDKNKNDFEQAETLLNVDVATSPGEVLLVNTSSPGILESRIFDSGWTSAWGSVWWNASLPAGSAISISTRSGNVPTVDGTWSPWSAPYPASGSPNQSPSAHYLQYRATLTTTAASPSLLDVSFAFRRYAAAGIATTEAFRPSGLLTWGRLEMDWSGPLGTLVDLSFSQDNGSSWVPATSGQNLASALAEPIGLRLVLSTASTAQTPRISSVSLRFFIEAPPLLPDWALWSLLLASLLALPVWLVLRHFFRTPFRATDIFLIHADGRLVARVGGAESPLNDELAASAMFTVVARFVTDSFADTSGARGQLKSFQVDEREVAIAKGTFLFIALLGTGARPPTLEAKMLSFLGELEAAYGPVLAAWNGFRVGLDDLGDRLRSFLDTHGNAIEGDSQS